MNKEKLSLLMDGEAIDTQFISELSSDNGLQQNWQRYHLIRDTMRRDVNECTFQMDLVEHISQAIENEPLPFVPYSTGQEEQPTPEEISRLPFWSALMKHTLPYISQIGIAACVALVAIVGVQQYSSMGNQEHSDIPAFNTVPVNLNVSPVSYQPKEVSSDNMTAERQEQLQQMKELLNNYELQRRLVID